jgi:hypothetical protein
LSSWLLTTSASSGCWRSASTSFGVQVATAPPESALSRVNWYWVRLTVLSRVKILHGLHVQRDARDPAVSVLQPADHLGDIRAALVARLQVDQKAAAVERDVVAVDADERGQARDVRIGEDGGGQRLLAVRHAGVGDRLGGLGYALDQAGVLIREEALGNQNVQQRGEATVAGGHPQVSRW